MRAFGILLCAAAMLFSASPAGAAEIVWHDAASLPLYGKACPDTPSRYERLPEFPGESLRPELRRLGRTSTGLYLRFRTDSPSIHIRWTSAGPRWMPHMAPVGTRGLDLYIHTPDGWKHAGSAKPSAPDKAESTCSVVTSMNPCLRECMLYLSLYDGVTALEIGLEQGYLLLPPLLDSPSSERKMVFYGTSILQGGCASRPGTAFTSRLSRRFDMEAINLGFSGNAFLDLEIARLMASVENPAVFVLDYVPNAWPYMIEERGEEFFRILRDSHPDVPVVFVEDPSFPPALFNTEMAKEISDKNKAQKNLYERLRKSGEKRLYYISSESLIGNEDTVDGIHPTDLGMDAYFRAYEKVLAKVLRRR